MNEILLLEISNQDNVKNLRIVDKCQEHVWAQVSFGIERDKFWEFMLINIISSKHSITF